MSEPKIDVVGLQIVAWISDRLSTKNGEVLGRVQCLGSQLESWSVGGIIYSIDIAPSVHERSGATIVPPPKDRYASGVEAARSMQRKACGSLKNAIPIENVSFDCVSRCG